MKVTCIFSPHLQHMQTHTHTHTQPSPVVVALNSSVTRPSWLRGGVIQGKECTMYTSVQDPGIKVLLFTGRRCNRKPCLFSGSKSRSFPAGIDCGLFFQYAVQNHRSLGRCNHICWLCFTDQTATRLW
ncbi:hypothetical protein AOLI_G00163760 [Acnodon oligacanthus]